MSQKSTNAIARRGGDSAPMMSTEPMSSGVMTTRAHNRFLTRAEELRGSGEIGALGMYAVGALAVYEDASFEKVVDYAVDATDRQTNERKRAYMQAHEENIVSEANDRLLDAFNTAADTIISIIGRDPTPPVDDRRWYEKKLKALPDE